VRPKWFGVEVAQSQAAPSTHTQSACAKATPWSSPARPGHQLPHLHHVQIQLAGFPFNPSVMLEPWTSWPQTLPMSLLSTAT
jgi:hypothetical protein